MSVPQGAQSAGNLRHLRSSTVSHFMDKIRLTLLFLKITAREFAADRLMLRAMALTYATVLSLVPLLAILFSLFKMLGGGVWFDEVVRPALMGILAPGAQPVVVERLSNLIGHFAAKTVGGIGFVLLLFTVHAIFSAVEATFNLIWGGAPRGRLLVRAPLYWGLLIFIPLMIGGSLVVTTYLTALPINPHWGFLDALEQRAIPWAMVFLSLLLLYKILPSSPVQWRAAIFGAVVAGLIYEVVKHLFLFYASKLVRYDVLYGSLAIVPLLLVWFNLAWIVTLFGVEIAYVFQHFSQLRRDPKHLPLSKQQSSVLAYALLYETAAAWGKENPWVDVGIRSEVWNLPAGVAAEMIERLVDNDILIRKGTQMDQVKLALPPDQLPVTEVDRILSADQAEVWGWPDDEVWDHVREWLSQGY